MNEEKQKILDMVANGTITPEEAIMLLEFFEDSSENSSSHVNKKMADLQSAINTAVQKEAEGKSAVESAETSHSAQEASDASGHYSSPGANFDTERSSAHYGSPGAAVGTSSETVKEGEGSGNMDGSDSGEATAHDSDRQTSDTYAAAQGSSSEPDTAAGSATGYVNQPEQGSQEGFAGHHHQDGHPYAPQSHDSSSSANYHGQERSAFNYSSKTDLAVKNINISWVNGPVEIRSYDGENINITEYSQHPLSDDDKLAIYEYNDTIDIKWNRDNSLGGISRYFGGLFLSKQLVVEIPRSISDSLNKLKSSTIAGWVLCTGISADIVDISSTSSKVDIMGVTAQSLKLNSITGAINISEITAAQLNLSSTSGMLSAENFSAGISNLNSVSGRIAVNGSTDVLKASTVSGKIETELNVMPSEVKLNSVSGRLELAIPQNQGFSLSYSTMSGLLQSDFPLEGKLDPKSGKGRYGTGESHMDFNTVSGRMTVRLK